MTRSLYTLSGASALLLMFSASAWAQASNELVTQAEQCRVISGRLERLACFDRVFQTPVDEVVIAPKQNVPPSWQRAMQAVAGSEAAMVLVTEGEGKGSNAWIALRALNRTTPFEHNAKPVLMVSCIDNLSRVELALPSSVEDARIQISVANAQPEYLRSDDNGVLMSSARGIPAIEMMKSMAREPRLVLRSNSPFADGLQFDASELNDALSALRERCGW